MQQGVETSSRRQLQKRWASRCLLPTRVLEAARWEPAGCLSFSLTFSQDRVSLQPYPESRRYSTADHLPPWKQV